MAPKLSLPGLSRAASARSARLRYGEVAGTTMVTGSALKRAIGAKSLLASYGRVLKRYGLAGRAPGGGGGKGEAAGGGVGEVIGGQNGVGARPVLDEDTLPEPLAEVAGHQA